MFLAADKQATTFLRFRSNVNEEVAGTLARSSSRRLFIGGTSHLSDQEETWETGTWDGELKLAEQLGGSGPYVIIIFQSAGTEPTSAGPPFRWPSLVLLWGCGGKGTNPGPGPPEGVAGASHTTHLFAGPPLGVPRGAPLPVASGG